MQKATREVTRRKQRVGAPCTSREVEPPQGRSATSTHTLRRWHLGQSRRTAIRTLPGPGKHTSQSTRALAGSPPPRGPKDEVKTFLHVSSQSERDMTDTSAKPPHQGHSHPRITSGCGFDSDQSTRSNPMTPPPPSGDFLPELLQTEDHPG